MSKIGISELAAKLQRRHQLSKEDAEHFVKLMFDVVNDGLHYEKLVKVKGLGSFKVMKVSARKSIDVNTGKPIVIEGRNKITFIPETAVKDIINRPFSQFETVMLNDGVELEDTESDSAALPPDNVVSEDATEDQTEQEELEVQTEEPVAEVAKVPMEEEQSKQEMVAEEADLPSAPPLPEAETSVPKQADQENEEPAKTQQNSPLSALAAEIPTPKETPNNIHPKDQDKAEDQVKENAHVENTDPTNSLLQAQLKQARSMVRILTVSTALLAILCCAGAFYLGRHLALSDDQQIVATLPSSTAEPILQPTNGTPEKSQQLPTAQTTKASDVEGSKQSHQAESARDAAALKPTNDIERMPAASTVAGNHIKSQHTVRTNAKTIEPKPQTEAELTSASTRYDKDPRVRTGAYRIVGIDQIVTVKKSQTLSSISKAYLGPGMECYVEAINGTTEVKEGQKIKIPKLKLKKQPAK